MSKIASRSRRRELSVHLVRSRHIDMNVMVIFSAWRYVESLGDSSTQRLDLLSAQGDEIEPTRAQNSPNGQILLTYRTSYIQRPLWTRRPLQGGPRCISRTSASTCCHRCLARTCIRYDPSRSPLFGSVRLSWGPNVRGLTHPHIDPGIGARC